MKTKIFVSSSSGLDYISHAPTISVLPDRIVFSSVEEYEDYAELKAPEFYTRLKYDNEAKPKILAAQYDSINKMIDQALKYKYEAFVVILNKFDDKYYDVIKKIIEKRPEINLTIIGTSLLSYPLALGAIAADKMIKAGKTYPEVEQMLANRSDTFGIYFFSPDEDILPSIMKIEYDEDIELSGTNANSYIADQNGITLVKKNKKVYPYQQLIRLFFDAIKDKETEPFILCTDEYSMYAKTMEKRLESEYPGKEIKKYYLTPEFGCQLGCNVVAVGYTEKLK
ncbi:MAG: DegV family protein [Acholeplasmatales bacterium]|nr:DegV family protein [Acholeplasmatales bacterium]